MEEEQTNQLKLGTWDNLKTEEYIKKPKVLFELNKEVTVEFPEDFGNPTEMTSGTDSDGVYYIFDVVEIGNNSREEKVIMTSAWTLLRGLKSLEPLKGKRVGIVKKMEAGKQKFIVEEKK
jgi:hypothetical protein